MNARILLVVAEAELVERLSGMLAAEGFAFESGTETEASTGDFDLVVLDAFAVCDDLRRKGIDTSILMLTARSRAEDRVTGLRLGADDCVWRFCDSNELLARIEALLRRVPRAGKFPVKTLRFGDVEIDFGICRSAEEGKPDQHDVQGTPIAAILGGPPGTRSLA
jgi:DNA-binding response OmpR family regulator